MTPITLQEVVDQNYQWFVVEKHPKSMNASITSCAYRGRDGARCAIGCVLPDSLYYSDMDKLGSNITAVIDHRPRLREFFKDIPTEALQRLQSSHDRYQCRWLIPFDQHMDKELRTFAFRYNLIYPPTT